MVPDEEPVADIFAVPVDGERLSRTGMADDQGD